jgi:hypothetical protein
VINGTNVFGKDNPRWPIGNATETIKVPDVGPPAPRGPASGPPGPAIPRTWVSNRPATAIGDALRTTAGIAVAWLAGLPRRTGNRLFAMNDAEAGWRGWQVTELAGGLARQYRDARFDTLRAPLEPYGGRVELDAHDGAPEPPCCELDGER